MSQSLMALKNVESPRDDLVSTSFSFLALSPEACLVWCFFVLHVALMLDDLPFCTRKARSSGSKHRIQMKFNNTILFFIVFPLVAAFYLWHVMLLFCSKNDIIFPFSTNVFREKKEVDLKEHK